MCLMNEGPGGPAAALEFIELRGEKEGSEVCVAWLYRIGSFAIMHSDNHFRRRKWLKPNSIIELDMMRSLVPEAVV
jgi:hypothetical protein